MKEGNYLLIKLYKLLWLLIHYLYYCYVNSRETIQRNWRRLYQRLTSCLPSHSSSRYYEELSNLIKSVDKLNKIPRHIAFSVVEEEQNFEGEGKRKRRRKNCQHHLNTSSADSFNDNSTIDFQTLAKIVSWAWVARIPIISLYDYSGRIKENYHEVGSYIQEELLQNYWALKKFDRNLNDPPTIKFHNVPKINGYSNGIGSNGLQPSNVLHIVVCSIEDGKSEIVRKTKEIYFEHLASSKRKTDNLNKNGINANHVLHYNNHDDKNHESNDVNSTPRYEEINSILDIDEKKLDTVLNRNFSWPEGAVTEPDLLVIFGNIQSTLGFLPWHIRLTEIHWLPKLDVIQIKDFTQALRKFARCQQRFGT